ncbi:MAG: hypothetical protein CL681_01705 [Blastopirellula sp.]|nr:hypothetical protein [Blastopirellula sp.]MAR08674.1 hypothetical protein [Blastopirellula sp.]|tara:strand:- start:524 stop:781 length:258 start_codon:yes stop_codon:yes gene_type:complete
MSTGYRPLTIEELTDAADIFFPRFKLILERMPEGSTVEDALNVMEKVAKLGHKQRHDKQKVKEFKFGSLRTFGFVKPSANTTDDL